MILEKIKQLTQKYDNIQNYNVQVVEDFFGSILLFLSEELNSSISYFCSLNRNHLSFESKIERIYKCSNYQIWTDFKWWEKEESSFLPILSTADNNYIFKNLDYDKLPATCSFKFLTKNEYVDSLKKLYKGEINNEKSGSTLQSQILENFDSFENIIFINVGSKKDSDGIFILNFQNKTVINENELQTIIYFINSIILDFFLRIKLQREKFISNFNFAISQLDILSNYYIENLIDIIAGLYIKDDSGTHCTEIGIFERFANLIDINSSNHKNYYDDDIVPERLGDKPLRIGEGRTIIDYVASSKSPYYVENADNETHKHYENVITQTKSQFTIPLVYHNQLIGVLNIGLDIPFGFLPYDRKILISLAQTISFTLNQKKLFLFQKGIAEQFTNKLYLLKDDSSLNIELSKHTNKSDEIQRVFFEYISPVYKDFYNYNLMLSRPKHSNIHLNDVIKSVCETTNEELITNVIKQFSIKNDSEKTRLINFLKSNLVLSTNINTEYILNFDKELLTEALIAMCVYSIDNCVRHIKKNGLNEKYNIVLKSYTVNKNLILEVTDNGLFPNSKFLSKRFNSLDYPKPLKIQGKFTNVYKGLPFVIIDYLFSKVGEMSISENDNYNSVKITFSSKHFQNV